MNFINLGAVSLSYARKVALVSVCAASGMLMACSGGGGESPSTGGGATSTPTAVVSTTPASTTPTAVVSTAPALSLLAGNVGGPGNTDALVAANARFSEPAAVANDLDGNVYVADYSNKTIRKITPQGVVTTIAGVAGVIGFQDGPGAQAKFSYPSGIAVDGAGNIYVADKYNNRIRKITVSAATGLATVSTVAGASASGLADGTSAQARFNRPNGLATDASGNLYVADTSNHAIRKISFNATGDATVSTLAGTTTTPVLGFVDGLGTAARFNYPAGVAVDGNGAVYVADGDNKAVRKITVNASTVVNVSTLAGSPTRDGNVNGPGAIASFSLP